MDRWSDAQQLKYNHESSPGFNQEKQNSQTFLYLISKEVFAPKELNIPAISTAI